jgi:hypothetical protein
LNNNRNSDFLTGEHYVLVLPAAQTLQGTQSLRPLHAKCLLWHRTHEYLRLRTIFAGETDHEPLISFNNVTANYRILRDRDGRSKHD